jgi:hypothetical protein
MKNEMAGIRCLPTIFKIYILTIDLSCVCKSPIFRAIFEQLHTMAVSYIFNHPLEIAFGTLLVGIVSYILHQRFFHPLARYPGPFLASLTDLWQLHQFITLKQPYNLTELHEKYGSIVRYGPDKLSITDEEAIKLIYQSGAKYMPKTEFYDAYGAAHPNIFGMRDESVSPIFLKKCYHSLSDIS